jgi:hypothetical protein
MRSGRAQKSAMLLSLKFSSRIHEDGSIQRKHPNSNNISSHGIGAMQGHFQNPKSHPKLFIR